MNDSTPNTTASGCTQQSASAPTEHRTAAEFWEDRYRSAAQVWSGNPNATLVDLVSDLAPGTAVDLGCGEGADVVWLAEQGWHTLGVDISPSAVARGRELAARREVSDLAQFEVANLDEWEGTEADLIVATFLHSPAELARTRILQTAAANVKPGGHLAVISHAAPPPWATQHAHRADMHHSAKAEFESLGLGRDWRALVLEERTRPATSPDGEPAELIDAVMLIQRLH